MLSLPPSTLIFLARDRVDGRKGIDSLVALIRAQFGRDPLAGHLFVFLSRRADRVRVLYWDRNGYVLTINYRSSHCTSFGSIRGCWGCGSRVA